MSLMLQSYIKRVFMSLLFFVAFFFLILRESKNCSVTAAIFYLTFNDGTSDLPSFSYI